MKLSEEIQIDDDRDIVTVCGIKYAGQLFRAFGSELEPGRSFRILSRDDGVVTVFAEEATKE